MLTRTKKWMFMGDGLKLSRSEHWDNQLITNSAAGPGRWALDHRWQRPAAAASSPAARGWAERSSGHRSPWPQRPSLTGSPAKGVKKQPWRSVKCEFVSFRCPPPSSFTCPHVHTFLLKSSLLSISCSLITSCFIVSEFLSVESDINIVSFQSPRPWRFFVIGFIRVLTSRLQRLVAEIKVILQVLDVFHSLVHQLDTHRHCFKVNLSCSNGSLIFLKTFVFQYLHAASDDPNPVVQVLLPLHGHRILQGLLQGALLDKCFFKSVSFLLGPIYITEICTSKSTSLDVQILTTLKQIRTRNNMKKIPDMQTYKRVLERRPCSRGNNTGRPMLTRVNIGSDFLPLWKQLLGSQKMQFDAELAAILKPRFH